MDAKEIRIITDSYNRKKFRRYTMNEYKSIFKLIKKAAKMGKSYVSFSPTIDRYDDGLGVVFRLFRLKNPSFFVDIKISGNDRVSIFIKW